MDEKSLVQTAVEMKKMSYAPYSNFHVGAALLGKDGHHTYRYNTSEVFSLENISISTYILHHSI